MKKNNSKNKSQQLPEKQQLEEEIIKEVDQAELAHIVETLPIPVNNPGVQSDFSSTLDKHKVYDRLEKIFLAIKMNKRRPRNWAYY